MAAELKANEYVCAQCREVCEKGWSDEEAEAEARDNGFVGMPCVLVCDPCYRLLMGLNGHEIQQDNQQTEKQ